MDPTARFSNRVQDYLRYRPGYPDELSGVLRDEFGLGSSSTVADIGSGTGISTNILLNLGCTTYAVEPNCDMRQAAEELLGEQERFHSIDGSADNTTLDDTTIDCIVAAQAFHWFDPETAKREFTRILKPNGIVALIWNERLTTSTPFLVAYEQLLLEFATDYKQVDHRNVGTKRLQSFLGAGYQSWTFENRQLFDFEGLRGRLLSSSYAPNDGPNFEPMLGRLREIFAANAVDGSVSFDYHTNLYVAQRNDLVSSICK